MKLDIAVVTDAPELFQDCEWVAQTAGIKSPLESRRIKTQIGSFSPFDKTLFLDADTEIREDVSGLFLSNELCLAPSLNQNLEEDGGGCPIRYNTGVILFNSSHKLVLNEWHEEWKKSLARDEFAFMRAISKTKTPVRELPLEFNSYESSPKIYHAYNRAKYLSVV